MSQQPVSQPGLQRRARLMRIANVPMRRLLALPFATPLSRRLMLLSYTGRKTGRAYKQPVSYVEDGDVLLTPAGGRWKLNLHEGEPTTVRLRGHDVSLRPEFVREPNEVERLLHTMMVENPRLTSFIPFIEPDKQIDRDKLEVAVDRGFAIIRWHIHGATSDRS